MILQLDAWLFWLIMMAIFLVAEALTVNLTTLWFAAGSLVALMLALSGQSVVVQIIAMVVVSVLLLTLFNLLVRPRFVSGRVKRTATNADRLIGLEALVTEKIDPIQGTGQIRARGQTWSANSHNQLPIEVGTLVEIQEIRGVKAIVKAREQDRL